MPIQHPPKGEPLPSNFVPGGSTPYPVSTGETWVSIAKDHRLDVHKLISFNFHTTDPDVVNWYLQRNVGCNVPTPDGKNWKFTSNLNPGLIYIPTQKLDFSPTVVNGKSTVSKLAMEYDGPPSPADYVGRFFDITGAVDAGLTMFEVGALDLLMIPLGAVGAAVGPILSVAGGHEAALNILRANEMKEGLSLGLVLAADGQFKNRPSFVRSFIKRSPVHNIQYQEYGKQLQGLFNKSFKAGIAHGSQFNTVAQKNLFDDLRRKMTDYARSEYDPHLDDKDHAEHYSKWSDRKWENYYRLCARIYAEHHLKER